MRISKITIVNEQGEELVFDIADAVVFAVTTDEKIIAQSSENEIINMKTLRMVLKTKEEK